MKRWQVDERRWTLHRMALIAMVGASFSWLAESPLNSSRAQDSGERRTDIARLNDGSTLPLSFRGWTESGDPQWFDEQDQLWQSEGREIEWGQGLAKPRGAIVRLHDGTLLVGSFRDLDPEHLRLETRWWPDLTIPRSEVSFVLLRPRWDSMARDQQWMLAKKRGPQDRCWLEGNDWIDGSVTGLVPPLAMRPRGSLPQGFLVELGDRQSTVSWERTIAIGFETAESRSRMAIRQRIRLRDGSQLVLNQVQRTAEGIVFHTATGWELPALPEQRLRLDEVVGVSTYDSDGVVWPSSDPLAAARVPTFPDQAADSLGSRPAWQRQTASVLGDERTDAIVIEATATLAWKSDEQPARLSLRLGLVDPHSLATELKLFHQQADGSWSKTPFWSHRLEPDEPLRPFRIAVPATKAIAINVVPADSDSDANESTSQATLPTRRVAIIDPQWHASEPSGESPRS